MNMLEQKFMELVPSALLRIAKALEGINEKLEAQNKLLRDRFPEQKPSEAEPIDYGLLEMEVQRMRVKYEFRAVTDALFSAQQHVGIKCATEFSKLYGGTSGEKIRNAIYNGEIAGDLPETEEISVLSPKTKQRMMVKKPIGQYNINLKSLVLWLEKNARRTYGVSSTISKCIERIINT